MSSQSSPAWVVKTTEPKKPSIETAVIRGFLLRPNLSTIAEVNASIIDIDDDSDVKKVKKVMVITDKGKKVGRVHQIQDKGQTLEKADKDSEVAISIRGIEIGRDIGKDEILYVNVPESHVRQLMSKFLNELTSDQKDVLRDYIKLMRATNHPWWGM